MSEEIFRILMENGFAKTMSANEVGFRLFRDANLVVWGFKSRLTANLVVGDDGSEPIFLPSMSSENADLSHAHKIIALKNALVAADENEAEDW